MSDKDNPFGPPPPEDPFGSKPPEDPFGRKPGEADSLADIWARAGEPPADPHGPPSNEARRAAPSPPPGDPFATPREGQSYASSPPPGGNPRRANGAIPALVLGILGLVFCPLCGPFAWALGRKAEQQVDASGGTLIGRGEATAGKILGIIGSVLTILVIVAFIGLIAVGSSVSTSP